MTDPQQEGLPDYVTEAIAGAARGGYQAGLAAAQAEQAAAAVPPTPQQVIAGLCGQIAELEAKPGRTRQEEQQLGRLNARWVLQLHRAQDEQSARRVQGLARRRDQHGTR
jgi:hypothetical protein